MQTFALEKDETVASTAFCYLLHPRVSHFFQNVLSDCWGLRSQGSRLAIGWTAQFRPDLCLPSRFNVCIHVYIHIDMCVYKNMCIYIYRYVYKDMYNEYVYIKFMYIYIYVYIHMISPG